MSSKNSKLLLDVNLFISKHQVDSLSEYLNFESFARHEALRKIGGFYNHGYLIYNLLIYPDTINQKLIITPHRDHWCHLIKNRYFFEKSLLHNDESVIYTRHYLLENLVMHDSIRLQSYKYIYEMYANQEDLLDGLEDIQNFHDQFFREPLIKKWFYHSTDYQAPNQAVQIMVKNNLSKIIKELTPKSPKVIRSLSEDSTLTIKIEPNSMSQLKIGGISILGNSNFNLIVERSYLTDNTQTTDTIFSVKNEKKKEFKKVINKLSFYDKIDENCKIINCTYSIKIQLLENTTEVSLDLKNFNIVNYSNKMEKIDFTITPSL
jgi:hypothetical protein